MKKLRLVGYERRGKEAIRRRRLYVGKNSDVIIYVDQRIKWTKCIFVKKVNKNIGNNKF